MEKIRIYNSGDNRLKKSFNNVLKENSELKPQATFTKEQEDGYFYTSYSMRINGRRPVKIYKNLDDESKIITWDPKEHINKRVMLKLFKQLQ